MSQTTKRALAASLKGLMAKKPLSKITISDITADCGMNRMTFYYHFQDIYDLIDWICQEEGAQAIQGRRNYRTWKEGFVALCHTVVDNRAFIEGVYRSVQREQIETYLCRIVYDLLFAVITECAEGCRITEEDRQYIADFYKYAFVGVVLDWVKSGLQQSPEELVGRMSVMLSGQLRGAIENLARGAAPSEGS